MKIEVKKGEFHEGLPWFICAPYDEVDPEDACAHCFDDGKKNTIGGQILSVKAAILASNEGGFNGTAVCLECIIENARKNNLI